MLPERSMRMLEQAYSSLPEAERLLPATVIAARASRSGMALRFTVVQSCGSQKLDNAALQAVKLCAVNSAFGVDREIFVNWSNINIAGKDEK